MLITYFIYFLFKLGILELRLQTRDILLLFWHLRFTSHLRAKKAKTAGFWAFHFDYGEARKGAALAEPILRGVVMHNFKDVRSYFRQVPKLPMS